MAACFVHISTKKNCERLIFTQLQVFFSRGPLLYKTLAQATKSMKYFSLSSITDLINQIDNSKTL